MANMEKQNILKVWFPQAILTTSYVKIVQISDTSDLKKTPKNNYTLPWNTSCNMSYIF